jgi:hypothetical protein
MDPKPDALPPELPKRIGCMAKEQQSSAYLDSGANKHMMNISEQFFLNYRRTQIPIITADSNSTLMATGVGDVQVKLFDQSKGKLVIQRLHEVLRVPGLSSNLISASALVKRGNSTSHIRLENKKALIHLNTNVIQANMNSKGMFKLQMTFINSH